MAEYKDPIIAKLIEKFEAEGPTELRGHYFHGDILLVPKREMPAVSIAKDETRIYPASNMEDEHYMPLVINVIYDWTKDLDQSSELAAGVTGLYKLVEERDSDYQLVSNSLAYVLRKYQTLDDDVWISVGPNEQLQINYGLGIERRGPGIFSVEAVIRCSVKIHKVRVSQL
jgi:hypothetical protein